MSVVPAETDGNAARLEDLDPKNLLFTDTFHCCARVGNHRLLCGRKERDLPWAWSVGPHRCGCVSSYVLIVVTYGLFLGVVAVRMHVAVVAGGALGCLGLLSVFSSVACADPGIVYRRAAAAQTTDDGEPYFNRCEICDVDRPKGARHCYDCGVCVMDLDHHCPLIGKCVGAKTIDRFQLTLIAVTVNLALVSILSIAMILGGG